MGTGKGRTFYLVTLYLAGDFINKWHAKETLPAPHSALQLIADRLHQRKIPHFPQHLRHRLKWAVAPLRVQSFLNYLQPS